ALAEAIVHAVAALAAEEQAGGDGVIETDAARAQVTGQRLAAGRRPAEAEAHDHVVVETTLAEIGARPHPAGAGELGAGGRRGRAVGVRRRPRRPRRGSRARAGSGSRPPESCASTLRRGAELAPGRDDAPCDRLERATETRCRDHTRERRRRREMLDEKQD